MNIDGILNSANLVGELDEEKTSALVEEVINGYEADKKSRKAWEDSVDKWTKLALQTVETKTFPWQNASNIKYPLLSTAAMQFNARAYPALVPADGKLVQVRVIGQDKDGKKVARAERVAKYMSYQLTQEMEEWEDDMDKLLTILPIVGTCFKKTYYDSVKKRNCSTLVLPKSLVVNYWAKTLEDAERKTEVIEMSERLVKERMLNGVYKKCDLSTPVVPQDNSNTKMQTPPPNTDATTPHVILEQHTFYDLDGDGYPEPYVITVHLQDKKLLRMVARFEEDDVIRSGDKITAIKPIEYYTKYGFIPNPDGGFYDLGFGLLLGPINASANTIINQLTDAGTLSNLQSGFLSKSLRMNAGDVRFRPGEWKWVNATGDGLKNGIFPMPVREPSAVLMKLLELLIASGKELASVSEIFVGKMPGQNTPATTTMEAVDQGMKLFTAIYKRIYKSLTKEYWKLFELNHEYLDPETIAAVLDEPVGPEDFDDDDFDVSPAADPTSFSSTQKMQKAQALLQMLPLGTLNPEEVTRRVLDAQEQPNAEKLMRQGPPPPDPKAMEMQMKGQLEQQKAQSKMAMDKFKAELESKTKQTQLMMEAQAQRMEMEHKAKMADLDRRIKMMEHSMSMRQTSDKHRMDMATKAAQHQQKMAQTKPKD